MSMKTLLNVLTIFSLGTLTGCDYIEKASLIDDLLPNSKSCKKVK